MFSLYTVQTKTLSEVGAILPDHQDDVLPDFKMGVPQGNYTYHHAAVYDRWQIWQTKIIVLCGYIRRYAMAERKPPRPNLIKSIAGALIGVQSEKNREIDFSQQRPLPFILAGIAAIALFVGVLVAVSQLVAGG
ncbi:DUF2970 domain-containing protein [Photobacterium rosenbergii]|nr:DUF2970 domain-containing protein [Photobacterium rosenbergii]